MTFKTLTMIQNFITELENQLKSREYHVRYPQLLDKAPKTHVLFLGPYLNATGLYRSIIPYIELNKTQTHSAIINQLIPEENNKGNIKTEWNLSDEIIQWADYIVFPTVTDDLTQNIQLLRSINKKKHLQFVFDIDDNYHIDQPGQNNQTAKDVRKNILKNMSLCNIVTCTNSFLGNFYFQQLATLTNPPKIFLLPNYMHHNCFLNTKITEQKPNKIRVGIILNRTQNQFNDILLIRKNLLEMQKKHKQTELVLFGWNGRIFNNGIMKDALRDVKYTYIERVPISQYFNKLVNLQLDFAIMPLLETTFNACKSHHKLLQYAQAGIPCIVSDVLPYNEILAPEGKSIYEHGYIPALRCKTEEDFTKSIDFFIEKPEARKNMGDKAKEALNQYYTWHTKPNYLSELYKNLHL